MDPKKPPMHAADACSQPRRARVAAAAVAMASSSSRRYIGVTVLCDYVISEGVDAVLANLLRVGASAVAINPTVTTEAPDAATGSWQPPSDGGTSPRLFDRPLFGKRALWVRSGSSFNPRLSLYDGCDYQPRPANDLTFELGHIIGEFIQRVLTAGLEVYLQIGGCGGLGFPGLRDEDRPRTPDGEVPPNRMADTASLASPGIRAYNAAFAKDLLLEYPDITGFRIDWPEYPCYTWGELFADFSPHVATFAAANGFDFQRIRTDVGAFKFYCEQNLTNAQLAQVALQPDRGATMLWSAATARPGVLEWLRLKAALCLDLVKDWRRAVDAATPRSRSTASPVQLHAHAFMPPWTLFTGLDFAAIAPYVDAISPKLYTMHWAQMVTYWATALLEATQHKHGSAKARPGGALDEGLLIKAIVRVLDMADGTESDPGGETLEHYHYPEPHEPHPVADGPQLRKIDACFDLVRGVTKVIPLIHGYGPDDDFARRVAVVAQSSAEGAWLNRYGYLGDAKLESVRQLLGGSKDCGAALPVAPKL